MASTPDATNFSPSAHRLPTVSAADALKTQQGESRHAVSTGLRGLDAFLEMEASGDREHGQLAGGLNRGHVYEVYGPPGSGKTAFGIQAASEALRLKIGVVWIDTSHVLPIQRLRDALTRASDSEEDKVLSSGPTAEIDHLEHFTTPTLSHLIALLGHPTSIFPSKNTGLIIVDTVSAPFATAFPRALEEQTGSLYAARKNGALAWASGRRWTVMSDFTARVSQLAATTDTAILLLSQTSTKMRTEHGTLLRPALSTRAWLDNIHTRLVLFRDSEETISTRSGKGQSPKRFIGIVKHAGTLYESLEHVFPFLIKERGLMEGSSPILPSTIATEQHILSSKRKREEIGDSETEDDIGSPFNEEQRLTEEGYMHLLKEDPVRLAELIDCDAFND